MGLKKYSITSVYVRKKILLRVFRQSYSSTNSIICMENPIAINKLEIVIKITTRQPCLSDQKSSLRLVILASPLKCWIQCKCQRITKAWSASFQFTLSMVKQNYTKKFAMEALLCFNQSMNLFYSSKTNLEARIMIVISLRRRNSRNSRSVIYLQTQIWSTRCIRNSMCHSRASYFFNQGSN